MKNVLVIRAYTKDTHAKWKLLANTRSSPAVLLFLKEETQDPTLQGHGVAPELRLL